MLRHFTHTPSLSLIKDTLAQFAIPVPDGKHSVEIIEFQILTPDSFIWRLLIGGAVYYLYAEDYIESLAYVRRRVVSYAAEDADIEFVRVAKPEEFNDAEPVKSAELYEEPADYNTMKHFAAPSGFDFVFLCKSNEKAEYARFNN